MKKLLNILSYIFPSFFANKLYYSILHPQKKKKRNIEIETLSKAKKEILHINNNKIQLYKWGESDNSILLVHGWEGHAGNYAELILKLLENNYTVYTFDGPGHGESTGGNNIMFEYLDTVDKIISKLSIHKLISHSFGSVVTTYALSLLPNHSIEKYVLLTTPYTFKNYVANMSSKLGINKRAVNSFFKKLEKERNQEIDEMNVVKYVKNVNVKNAIIIHDINDRVIPINEAKTVVDNWKNADLIEIKDTGHFKILRSPKVHNMIIEFLSN